MPDPAVFLASFGLNTGSALDGWTVRSSSASHTSVIRYREYVYNITLSVIPSPDKYTSIDNLLLILNIKSRKTVLAYSNYGNPYNCKLDPPSPGDAKAESDGSYTVYLKGHSYRV